MTESKPLIQIETTKPAQRGMLWLMLATIVSAVGVMGSVSLSLGLGLKACPLCFYQRSFVMAALSVLLLGWMTDRSKPGLFCLLSLPSVIAGAGVALFHEYLVLIGTLECPQAFLVGTAPAQSVAVFSIITAATLGGVWSGRHQLGSQPAKRIGAAILVGAALSWACVASAPPMPKTPTSPYDPVEQPLDMCRPPFRPA